MQLKTAAEREKDFEAFFKASPFVKMGEHYKPAMYGAYLAGCSDVMAEATTAFRELLPTEPRQGVGLWTSK